jgi:hypothetical protein
MRYNLGSGDDLLVGYCNCDVRPCDGLDWVTDLSKPHLEDAEEVFSNAFFEHLHIKDRVNHLESVYNSLKPNGFINYMGMPWFPGIVEAYLEQYEGTMGKGTVFDLYHVYRYTHGAPDEAGEYIPQLHKGLWDYDEVFDLMEDADIPLDNVALYTYSYPGEPTYYSVTFGFHIINKDMTYDDHMELVEQYLSNKTKYVNPNTVVFH